MAIVISPIDESSFTYGDVANLMHSSFEERLHQGLNFTCSTMTVDQFKEKTKEGIVFVAWDSETKDLLGTATLSLHSDIKGSKYGYYEYLAVSASAKRMGIGSLLLEEHIHILNNAGGQYLLSDTAVGAKSSVRWHKKNGFRIIGLASYTSTNYYSYLFRKQLVPSLIWNNPVFCWLMYIKSSVNTRVRRKADGSPSIFSSIIKSIIRSK